MYLVEERTRQALPVLCTGRNWWGVRDQFLLQVDKGSWGGEGRGGEGRGGEREGGRICSGHTIKKIHSS